MIPGFSFDDCSPIQANEVEFNVAFKDHGNLVSLRGEEVVVLFEVFNADLYGFRFSD